MLTDRTASPPAWTPGYRIQVRRHRACEVDRHLHDRGAKKEFHIGISISIFTIGAEALMNNAG